MTSTHTIEQPRLTKPQPVRCAAPLTKATTLAYLMFERPDLDLAETYLTSFGLRVTAREPDKLFLRGTAPSPYCYVVFKAAKPRFVGLAFTVPNAADLTKLSALPGASSIEAITWPGGGKRVQLRDPAGFRVDAVWGQQEVETLPHRTPIRLNAPGELVRVDDPQRPPFDPPEVVKLGHVLIEVANFQAASSWYTRNFGLIPSDVCVFPDGAPGATFFRLDLGDQPADHHTLAMAQSFMAAYGHSAYELVDLDAIGVGQRLLQNAGWEHSWGIGRHMLGSQVFDYWQDPWGDKHEHYCDGDVFTSATPTGVYPISREAMAQWGPQMPKSFTKPHINLKTLTALSRNLYGCEDLSIKRLKELIKLFA